MHTSVTAVNKSKVGHSERSSKKERGVIRKWQAFFCRKCKPANVDCVLTQTARIERKLM